MRPTRFRLIRGTAPQTPWERQLRCAPSRTISSAKRRDLSGDSRGQHWCVKMHSTHQKTSVNCTSASVERHSPIPFEPHFSMIVLSNPVQSCVFLETRSGGIKTYHTKMWRHQVGPPRVLGLPHGCWVRGTLVNRFENMDILRAGCPMVPRTRTLGALVCIVAERGLGTDQRSRSGSREFQAGNQRVNNGRGKIT